MEGTATVEAEGASLHLVGNLMKAIDLPYTVTPYTVVEFDFRSRVEGEVHAIGTDLDPSDAGVFKVHGTESGAFTMLDDYAPSAPDYLHYRLQLGDIQTGDMTKLWFMNDQDVVDPDSESYFANVRIYENALVLNVDGVSQPFKVEGFGSQDRIATVLSVEDDGATLRMAGNTWKKVGLNYTLTPDTMLEFDFASSQQGEFHAIGFDTDDQMTGSQLFQLYGTERGGLQAFRNYDPANGLQHFVIPVGEFFTGDMTRLVLVNDDDASALGESVFSNLRVYENLLDVEVEGSTQSFEVESFGSQDQVATTLSVEDGGATLRMAGNTWKKVGLTYTLTPDTMLEFDFASSQQGEFHAIGFDTDDQMTGSQLFQLYGTERGGLQAFRNYDPANGLQHFVIPVGEFFTGDMTRLVLVNDDDASALGESVFSNLRVYENLLDVEVKAVHSPSRWKALVLRIRSPRPCRSKMAVPPCGWPAIPGRRWG